MNQNEYTALSNSCISHEAKILYICLRRYMNYETGLTSVSLTKLVQSLEYNPAPKSNDKPYSATVSKVRNAIKVLERNNLITLFRKGNARSGEAAIWQCNLARKDANIALIYPNQARQERDTIAQHQAQHTEAQQIQGLESEARHQARTGKNAKHDTYPLSDKDIYKTRAREDKPKRFIKPTQQQVFDYMSQKGFADQHQAERFIDHYESNGWKVGKNPMKDWQAAVRNWLKNLKDKTYAKPTSTHSIAAQRKQEVDDFFNDPNAQLEALMRLNDKKRTI